MADFAEAAPSALLYEDLFLLLWIKLDGLAVDSEGPAVRVVGSGVGGGLGRPWARGR